MLNFSITKKSVSLLVWENAEKGSKGGTSKNAQSSPCIQESQSSISMTHKLVGINTYILEIQGHERVKV